MGGVLPPRFALGGFFMWKTSSMQFFGSNQFFTQNQLKSVNLYTTSTKTFTFAFTTFTCPVSISIAMFELL
tara:strand:+ start:349 stop:561 length:213 start_codon:yes stop_codon:yes gene_type:complete